MKCLPLQRLAPVTHIFVVGSSPQALGMLTPILTLRIQHILRGWDNQITPTTWPQIHVWASKTAGRVCWSFGVNSNLLFGKWKYVELGVISIRIGTITAQQPQPEDDNVRMLETRKQNRSLVMQLCAWIKPILIPTYFWTSSSVSQ